MGKTVVMAGITGAAGHTAVSHGSPGAPVLVVAAANATSTSVATLVTGVMSISFGTVGTASMAGIVADVNATTHECTCDESCVGKGAACVTDDGPNEVTSVTTDVNAIIPTVVSATPPSGLGLAKGPVAMSITGSAILAPIVTHSMWSSTAARS